jgi:hypothetical protein
VPDDRRIGAYVLAGDPVWLASTLAQYYPLLDDLVVAVAEDARGWSGATIPVGEVREVIRTVDTRGIAREISGSWTDPDEPIRADTAQRQAALDAVSPRSDWVLQIDNDEFLPDPPALLAALDEADRRNLPAVEWPMRVLYRQTRSAVFEVVGSAREPRYDYPGPVAVKPGVELIDARRTAGAFLRATVQGDTSSLQLSRPPGPMETRWPMLRPEDAIVHNSWARSPKDIRRKIRTWGHARGWRDSLYYFGVWLPAPLTWRLARDIHPFAKGLWPRLLRRAPQGPECRR